MKKLAAGALAGLAAALLLAGPALAAAGVTVRVEGQDQTLVPRTLVRTLDKNAVQEPNGTRFCKGSIRSWI